MITLPLESHCVVLTYEKMTSLTVVSQLGIVYPAAVVNSKSVASFKNNLKRIHLSAYSKYVFSGFYMFCVYLCCILIIIGIN